MRVVVALLGLLVASCGDTTGGALVKFSAVAKGATGDGPISFATGSGAKVSLDKAHLHVGAVYLNQTVPTSGSAPESCISQGLYVGEVYGPLDVDLLSSAAQPFPNGGDGTTTQARTAEVWLTGGDINATDDNTVILDLEGTAQLDAGTLPFTATVTIAGNRLPAVTDPSLPSADPICRQRIVSPLLVDLTPAAGGQLTLQIDSRRLLDSVDFSTQWPADGGAPASTIPDDPTGAGGGLFRGLHSSAVYQFSWSASP